MRYAHAPITADVATGPQLFAVPAHAVVSHDAQGDMWAWWGDALVPCDQGFFEVGPDGVLEFRARDDGE